MKKFIFFIFLSCVAYSQTDTTVYDATDTTVAQPRWPGCDTIVNEKAAQDCWNEHFRKFMSENLEWPHHCYECVGKVWIEFIIGTDGSLIASKILKGVAQPLDEEALSVIRQLPIFIPAKKNGRPVKFSYRMPIVFKMG